MIEYIGNNYEKVLDICKIYSINDYDNVMGVLIDIFMNKKHKIKDDNKFFYLITCIRNEVFNKKSKYNKLYNNFVEYNEYNFDVELDEENDDNEFEIDIKLEQIFKILNKLYKEKKINKEEKSSFLFYYIPENYISIRKMDKKSVDKLRKISYRKLEDITNVDYQTIRFNVIKVNQLIKEEINKK